MKVWEQKIKLEGKIYTVKEHTDKECSKSRNDGKILAPISHGFVCLYDEFNIYKLWCGERYAENHIIKKHDRPTNFKKPIDR